MFRACSIRDRTFISHVNHGSLTWRIPCVSLFDPVAKCYKCMCVRLSSSPLPFTLPQGGGEDWSHPGDKSQLGRVFFLKNERARRENSVSFAKRCVVYKEEPYFSGKRGAKSSAATASWLEAVDEFIIKRGLRNKTATKTGGEEIYNLESGPVT